MMSYRTSQGSSFKAAHDPAPRTPLPRSKAPLKRSSVKQKTHWARRVSVDQNPDYLEWLREQRCIHVGPASHDLSGPALCQWSRSDRCGPRPGEQRLIERAGLGSDPAIPHTHANSTPPAGPRSIEVRIQPRERKQPRTSRCGRQLSIKSLNSSGTD